MSKMFFARQLFSLLTVLIISLSCKTSELNSAKATSANVVPISRGFPGGSPLGRAVRQLRPLHIRNSNKFATAIPLSRRQALSVVQPNANAANFDVDGVPATSIASYPKNPNISLLTFDKDVFDGTTPPAAIDLQAGDAGAIAGIGPSVSTVEGVPFVPANPEANIEVRPTTVISATNAQNGLQLKVTGFSSSAAEIQANAADGEAGADGSPSVGGRAIGGPLIVQANDQPAIAGIVTTAENADSVNGETNTVATVVSLKDPGFQSWATNLAASWAIDLINHIFPPRPTPWLDTDIFDPKKVEFGYELEFTTANVTVPKGINENTFGPALKAAIAQDPNMSLETATYDRYITQSTEISYTLTSAKDNVSFTIYPYEDEGVLEVPTSPLTQEKLSTAVPYIQKFIFDVAASCGVFPSNAQPNRLSGHANMAWPALQVGGDTDLFMRFFFDMQSANTLWMGALAGDIRNAPPLSIYGDNITRLVNDLVDSYNQDPHFLTTRYANYKYANPYPTSNTFDMASYIRDGIYKMQKFAYPPNSPQDAPEPRYNLINLDPLSNQSYLSRNPVFTLRPTTRIEFRGNFMPLTAEGMNAFSKIILSRLTLAASRKGPIRYTPTPTRTITPADFSPDGMQASLDPNAEAEQLAQFLSEGGEDLQYHAQHLVLPVFKAAFQNYLAAHSDGPNAAAPIAASSDTMDTEGSGEQGAGESQNSDAAAAGEDGR